MARGRGSVMSMLMLYSLTFLVEQQDAHSLGPKVLLVRQKPELYLECDNILQYAGGIARLLDHGSGRRETNP